jgi:ornithine cyclodeaminase
VEEAVNDAEIICTVTSSRQPILFGDWIQSGSHINAVGACTPAARELDTSAMVKSKIFTDSYESLFHEAGDYLFPRSEGAIGEADIRGELGEVLIGNMTGRENENEITLFKSLGIASEDLFSAWHIYQKIVNPRQVPSWTVKM